MVKRREFFQNGYLRPTSGISKNDEARIRDFADASGMRVSAIRHRVTDEGVYYRNLRIDLSDGRSFKGGYAIGPVSAENQIISLIYAARQHRDFPEAREHYEKGNARAREIFGDSYETLVNPARKAL